MNDEHVKAFPVSPQFVQTLAHTYIRLATEAGLYPATTALEFLGVPQAFFTRWFMQCKTADDFLDLCDEFTISETICGILNDVRFLYYLRPETLADFMAYSRDVTREARRRRVKSDLAAARASKIKYNLLDDVPKYVDRVQELIESVRAPGNKAAISEKLREFMTRDETIEKFLELSDFVIKYCAMKPAVDEVPAVDEIEPAIAELEIASDDE